MAIFEGSERASSVVAIDHERTLAWRIDWREGEQFIPEQSRTPSSVPDAVSRPKTFRAEAES